MAFFHDGCRLFQDGQDSRRIADRLFQTRRRDTFGPDEREIIEGSSFFFIATADQAGRPDCSVKGGTPGFVRVTSSDGMEFPDYDGNGMFRTLGNIAVNPAVGLLFVEFSGSHRKLRVNGEATVVAVNKRGDIPGAQFVVRIVARDIFPNCPRYLPRMRVQQASPFNPRPGYTPPEPLWKEKPDLRDFLPRTGREITGGTI